MRFLVRVARRVPHDQSGFSLVEVMAALTLLTIGFIALGAATGTTAKLLVRAKHRQSGADYAGAQIEDIRNLPYDQAGLTAGLSQNPDPDHPDHDVSSDGVRFDPGTGTEEVLITGGNVQHYEQVTVGSSVLDVYRYVTWVDDAAMAGAQDYRRITVIVLTNDPNLPEARRQVAVSAFLTDGTVSVGGAAQGAQQGTQSTSTPSPSPTGASCAGDTTPPTGSFSITSGAGAEAGYTASTTVSLALAPSDPCTPITAEFSNDGVSFSGEVVYDANNPTATWTLATGDGTKSVWVRYADGVDNSAVVGPETIVLDQTLPTVPGTLTRTVSCSGSSRTVILGWGVSTDTNLLGYRVYRSIDSGDYALLTTVSDRTATDTHSKTLTSVRYKVVAYDKAGNEGSPTNEISLAKNQCS